MSQILLDIAKQAILDHFEGVSHLNIPALLEKFPHLATHQATFVTLTLNKQLCGCIGSLIAHRPLLEDLIHNAHAAAFEDPRFYPLSKEEFKTVQIEISLLSAPEVVTYTDTAHLKEQIRVGEDGIILQKGSRRATFLPQVWEQLNTFELFFSHLCQKAGLEPSCLENYPEIWRYRVEKVK